MSTQQPLKLCLILLTLLVLISSLPAQTDDPFQMQVRKLSDKVLVITGGPDPIDPVNTIALASQKGLVIIDPNLSQSYGKKIREIIEEKFGRKDFFYVINTHEHRDHTGGNQVFHEAEIIAHEKCYKKIKHDKKNHEKILNDGWIPRRVNRIQSWKTRLVSLDKNSEQAKKLKLNITGFSQVIEDYKHGFEFTPPTIFFNDRVTFNLGDLTLQLFHYGKAHTEGDIIILIPEEKLLVTGDLSFGPDIARAGGYEGKLDVSRWLEILHYVLDGTAKIDHIISGHNPVWPFEYLTVHRDYLKELWEGLRAVKTEGLTIEEALNRFSLKKRFVYIKKWNQEMNETELDQNHQGLIKLLWKQL